MVTRPVTWINFYRLRFTDDDDHDIYQNVLSKNVNTLMYYAKKMMRQRNLYLMEFDEISVGLPLVWLTKYRVQYTEVHERPKRLLHQIADHRLTFDEISRLATQSRRESTLSE